MSGRYVEDLLKDKQVYYRYSGNDLLVSCFNLEHDDKNPSMRIDKTTGIYNCFSCGFKGNIFKYYGILTNLSFLKVAKLKEKLKNLKVDREGLEVPPVAIPFTKPLRGIKASTFKEFEAFYLPGESKEMRGFEDRIIFPIRDITGKIRVFQGRHTLSSGKPKYLNFPAHTELNPYPIRFSQKYKSLLIVEGFFDMLNVRDKGLENVATVFGTQTLLNNTKEKLLPYKMQGITKIYIMFDGDTAGRDAAKKLKPVLEEIDFEVEIINLEDDSDPGELSQEYIDSIKEYING